MTKTTPGQTWAALIRRGATPGGANVIIAAINAETANGVNRGAVMVACAYVLAQSIVAAGADNAAEIRDGIRALVDGYATEVALETQ